MATATFRARLAVQTDPGDRIWSGVAPANVRTIGGLTIGSGIFASLSTKVLQLKTFDDGVTTTIPEGDLIKDVIPFGSTISRVAVKVRIKSTLGDILTIDANELRLWSTAGNYVTTPWVSSDSATLINTFATYTFDSWVVSPFGSVRDDDFTLGFRVLFGSLELATVDMVTMEVDWEPPPEVADTFSSIVGSLTTPCGLTSRTAGGLLSRAALPV